MAAGVLSQPGTEYGPCADPCGHRDCALSRAMAEAECLHCAEPVGYGVAFYHVDTVKDHPLAEAVRVYAHALCEEKRIDEVAK